MSSTAEEHEALTLAQLLQTDGLPGVFCTPLRPWRDIPDEALKHLVAAQTDAQSPIYVHHGELVRIVRKEDGSPSIEALTEPALKDLLARSMNFVRMGTRGPMHIAPPDGMLLDRSGYDQATRLYYAPTPGLVLPPIPEHPSDEEIVDALSLIDEALGEFPYQDTRLAHG